MKQLNTYSYANGEVADAENLIECIESNRRGYASISIYNLSGTAIPVIKAGTTIEIGGTIYTAEADETAKYYNGTSFIDATYVNVPSGTYYLALVPSSAGSGETTELTLCIMAMSSIEYNQDYRGWYQTNTMNRIIGGITVTVSGSSLTTADKWLMTHTPLSYNLENPASPFFRLYSDGIEGVIRCNHGNISLYDDSYQNIDHLTAVTDFADFTANCPSRLIVGVSARAYGVNYNNGYSTTYTITLIALTIDGGELGPVGSPVEFSVNNNTNYKRAIFCISPGRYKVRFSPKYFTCKYGAVGGASGTISLYVHTSHMQAYLTDIYGAKKGTY